MGDHQVRPADASDFEFAWSLYAEAVKPMIAPLMTRTWQDSDEKARFAQIWKSECSSIVMIGNERVGWFSVEETADQVKIGNGYLVPAHRGRGIGSEVLRGLIQSSHGKGKQITLSTLPEKRLENWYKRHGFNITSRDQHSIAMSQATKA